MGREHGEIYDTETPKAVIRFAQRNFISRALLEFGLRGRKSILQQQQADLVPTLSTFDQQDWFAYIGDGSGHLRQGVQEATKAKVVAVDIDDIRTNTTKDVRFVKANGRRLPFLGNSLKGVAIFYTAHLVERPEELIQSAVDSVEEGGKIIIIEDTLSKPPKHPWSLLAVRIMNRVLNTQKVWSPEESYSSVEELKGMLVKAKCIPEINTKTWHWNLLDLIGVGGIWRFFRLGEFEATRLIATKSLKVDSE